MKPRTLLLLIALYTSLAACSPLPSVAPTTAPPHLQTLRIELPTDVDIADLPRLMAADTLREQGYTIEPLDFQDNGLSTQALVQDDVDFSFVGTGFAWKAIQEGAKIVSVVDGSQNQATLVVTEQVQQCADLDGKRVAVPSISSNRALYLKKYIENRCPTATVEPIVIASQNNSLLALATGQADGTVVDYAQMLAFESKEHANLHALVKFVNEFPGLTGAVVVTRRELVEKNPQAMQDFIRANLAARRKLEDPQVFADQLVKYIKLDPEEAKTSAQIFSDQHLWDPNGGITTESLQANLDFLTEAGSIEPGLKPSDVADRTPLDAVLNEIGKK